MRWPRHTGSSVRQRGSSPLLLLQDKASFVFSGGSTPLVVLQVEARQGKARQGGKVAGDVEDLPGGEAAAILPHGGVQPYTL